MHRLKQKIKRVLQRWMAYVLERPRLAAHTLQVLHYFPGLKSRLRTARHSSVPLPLPYPDLTPYAAQLYQALQSTIVARCKETDHAYRS